MVGSDHTVSRRLGACLDHFGGGGSASRRQVPKVACFSGNLHTKALVIRS